MEWWPVDKVNGGGAEYGGQWSPTGRWPRPEGRGGIVIQSSKERYHPRVCMSGQCLFAQNCPWAKSVGSLGPCVGLAMWDYGSVSPRPTTASFAAASWACSLWPRIEIFNSFLNLNWEYPGQALLYLIGSVSFRSPGRSSFYNLCISISSEILERSKNISNRCVWKPGRSYHFLDTWMHRTHWTIHPFDL